MNIYGPPLAIVAMLAPCVAIAQGYFTNEEGQVFRFTSTSEVALYAYRGGPGGSVTVPSQITTTSGQTYSVTKILQYAFTVNEYPGPNNPAITAVSLPNSLKEIVAGAFWGLPNVQTLNIPNNVQRLGEGFLSTSGVRNITIGSGVTTMGNFAGAPATGLVFQGAASLTNISVSSANPAFASVNGVVFNKALTRLVYYPRARTNTVYSIPNTVRNVALLGFEFAAVDEILIPLSVTNLEQGAFSSSLIKRVTLPASIKSLGNGTFARCPYLEQINLSEGLTNIGPGVLSTDSPFLKFMIFPASLKYIHWPPSRGAYTTGGLAMLFLGAPPQTAVGARWGERNLSYQLYYLSPTQGWPSSFAGLPAQLLSPKPHSQTYASASGFEFNWAGSGNLPMTIRRSGAPGGPWETIATNITAGTFVDPDPPLERSFYRATFP